MDVLVNATSLGGVLTGVARYTRSLYERIEGNNLAKVSYFYGMSASRAMPVQSKKGYINYVPQILRPIARNFRLTYQESVLRRTIKQQMPGVYHETGLIPLHISEKVPTVFTIYDLSLLHLKHCHPKDRIEFFERNIHRRINEVSHILTISNFVKQEIIETLCVGSESVTAIPLAPDPIFERRRAKDVETFLIKNNLPERYLLYVGTLEPRKNLTRVVQALAKMRTKISLICAGWSGWLSDEFRKEIKKLGLDNRVLLCGHVSDWDLSLLYSGAVALVYPSLYEGFGLPVVEAMRCHCPVITSDKSSMPEVAGDAAIFVDPYNVDALAKSFDSVINDAHLREKLITLGKERALSYSWDETAKRTVQLFADIGEHN